MAKKYSLLKSTAGLLLIGAIVHLSALLFILLYAVTGLKPYIELGSGSTLGFIDFKRGVPVAVQVSARIPDSSFYSRSGTGQSLLYTSDFPIGPDRRGRSSGTTGEFVNARARESAEAGMAGPVAATYKDTIIARYRLLQDDGISNAKSYQADIRSCELLSGKLHVEAKTLGGRFLLVLPMALYFLLTAFGLWQAALLLNDVLRGKSFNDSNHGRLRNIGWAVLGYQFILLAFELVFRSWPLAVYFESSIPDYRPPFDIGLHLEYDFSISWLVAGSILLILSYAFREGNLLQTEQDLTI